MSSSWFLGDCAVLQVDDRCEIFRLSLSSEGASLSHSAFTMCTRGFLTRTLVNVCT